MGYRSEVVLLMSKEVTPYFLTFLASNPDARIICENSEKFVMDPVNDWVIHWHSIKWYEGYEGIEQIATFVDCMNCDDISDYGCTEEDVEDSTLWSEHFKFIRVGENHDDVVVQGEGYFDVYPETRISGL